MKTLLPADFTYEKYGVKARFVTEEDAEFILDLRLSRGQFVHPTDFDINKQIEWMSEYKKREMDGLDYYFMYLLNGERVGVHRIYNINWERLSFTGGSWFCKPGTPMQYVALTSYLTDEIAFDILGLKINLYDVRKGNKKVLRFHREIACAIEYGETELDYLFYVTDETRKNNQIKTLFNL